MKRVCVIGDSHIAALKLGWETIGAEFADVEIDFYGATSAYMDDFAVCDGRLVAESDQLAEFLRKTSGGRDSIDGSYALYLTCGIGASIDPAVAALRALYVKHRKALPRTAVPDEEMIDAFVRKLERVEAASVLAKLREITDAPTGLICVPLPSAEGYEQFLERIRRARDEARVARNAIRAFERVAKMSDTRFLPQPQETLGKSPLTTAERYFVKPARLARQDLREDRNHANAEYGEIVLRNALATMLAPTPPSP